MNSLNDTATGAAALLRELGVYEVTKGVWAFSDMEAASHSYIHHSRKPVALAAYAAVDPTFARGRFPGYTLIELVDKMPSLDGYEYTALAHICGAPAPAYPSVQKRGAVFGTTAWEVVAEYGLEPVFMQVSPYGSDGSHYTMRPRGYEHASGEPIPGDLKAMRKAYRGMTPLQQVMTLTLMHLYCQGPDAYYLTGGCPTKIHAADALAILGKDGIALSKWGRLVSHYAGW